MSFVVREVQSTPNPNAMKFVLDRTIADVPTSFRSVESAAAHAVAAKLFAIPGVAAVLLLNDFVTINKTPGATWKAITPKAKQILTAS